MRRLLVALVILLVPVTGCVVVGPSCGRGSAAIVVTPSTVVVAVGSSVTPHATWCDRGHHQRVSSHWSLARAEDDAVIDLDPATGRITGRRVGEATVIVTAESVGEESRVQVTVH